MKPEEQEQHSEQMGEQISKQTADTVVHFPRDATDTTPEVTTGQDKLFNALGFLFPQNKIHTSGLPLAFDPERGAQIAQIACVKRGEELADVFMLIRTADDTAEAGYRERVLPMNGFRPEAAEAYIQRFAMNDAPLAIPHKCASASDRIAALELRGILLASLH